VFNYVDTASSRSKIDEISKRLAQPKVAIIGLGGTGDYVLDSVAKCPVGEIHLFDKDFFLNHNAFRAPGAPSLEELTEMPRKVDHFVAIYSKMHRHVVPHPYDIDSTRIEDLREMSFVFLCIDRAPDKELIVRKLQEWGIAFIDVGMGIKMVNDRLTGILRTTTSTDCLKSHIWEKDRISFSADDDAMNEYATNIQVADLNALNALLEVVKWKNLQGFYADMDDEHYSHFVLNSNGIINDDYPGEST
jgi:tRNA A37 threonylcarbamoyladenosine dehydratase